METVSAGDLQATHLKLYKALASSESKAALSDWMFERLQGRTKVEWLASLQAPDVYFGVLDLLGSMGRKGLGFQLAEAIVEAARPAASAEPLVAPTPVALATNSLSSDAKEVLEDKLLTLALRADGDIRPAFFEIFGELLIGALRAPEARHITELYEPLVNRKNARGLKWMIAAMHAHPDLPTLYPQAHVSSLLDKIGEWRESEPASPAIEEMNIFESLFKAKA
jgi:hypothetical protein